MDKEERKSAKKLKTAILYYLTVINTERRKKCRNDLAKAISYCDYGKELSVIFSMYLMDDSYMQSIHTRIRISLKKLLAGVVGQYSIEPYQSFANGLPLKRCRNDLKIHCSNADPNINIDLPKMLKSSKHFHGRFHANNISTHCLHIDTRCYLRIYISEICDLQYNEFITRLKKVDERIKELMMFLGIWFKNIHASSEEFIPINCVMTLITFYLQNTNPPILESIKTMQQSVTKSIILMNFTTNIHQLIKGFFEFYSSLDFENVIIAPYLGKVINKADFQNKVFKYPEYEAHMDKLSASPSERAEKLETDCPVCVQDMFQLNRNIAIAKQKMHIHSFECNCKYLKICIAMAHKMCCDQNMSIKDLYNSLLVSIIEKIEILSITIEYESLVFHIKPRDDELKSLEKITDQPLKLRKLWTNAYIAAIPQIVTAVFKIKMTLLPPTGNFIFKNIDETEELPLPFIWSISSSTDLWTHREMQQNSETFMELQLAHTEELYAKRRDAYKFAVKLEGFITVTISKNFDSLEIKMSSNEYDKKDLCKFYGSFKEFFWKYNLSHRMHLLETELQTKIVYSS